MKWARGIQQLTEILDVEETAGGKDIDGQHEDEEKAGGNPECDVTYIWNMNHLDNVRDTNALNLVIYTKL